MKKTLSAILIVILVLAVLTVAGLLAYQHFAGQTTDGPVMENPAAPMLELLNAGWMSEDGVWSAHIGGIEGNTFDLSYRQELVYSGDFTFDFNGDDPNVKTELQFYDTQFESEDGSVCSTMESLYVEKCRMYLDITISKDGGDSMRQQAVLNRAEDSKPAELETEEIREVSEMAELVEFSWRQSAMSYDDCFQFRIKTTQQDLSDPRLYCRYADPQTHEPVEIGNDASIGFQGYGLGGTKRAEGETWLPVPLKRWEELADFLRKVELSAYRAPLPGLLDATSSIIAVTWQEDGEEFTNRYGGGTSAHDLLELLQGIAREAYSQKNGQNQPAPEGSWTCSCGQTGNTGRFCPECGKPFDEGDMQ